MTRSIKILLIFLLCLIILTSATPFLKTLLTTTATPTHISDFRNLPRSDSRANKPDIFPGFDFLDESTTMRPKTPLDFYGKFIGGIVNQGRQTYERIVNNFQKYEINRRATLSQKLEYLPVAGRIVATTERVQESTAFVDENFKSSKEQNWSKKYFSSILTSVALNKLRNASDPEYLSKMIGASATYIHPLLDVWKRATLQLNFERNRALFQQYNQSTDNAKDTISNTYPSPTPPQPTNDSIEITNLVSNPSSSSLGYRYAFSKYLNWISKGYGNDDENKTIAELPHGVPTGVNLNNNNGTGVDGVDFPIERIDERNDDDDDDDIQDNDDDVDEDDDDESNENGNYNADNFGIFILEIFGTIAGLTWGAFSQLQNLFAQNGK